MRHIWRRAIQNGKAFRYFLTLIAGLIFAGPVFAQATGGSPWENAVNVLMQAFTSTIARGLSLVAIVVSGLTFAFGEGGSKRVLAGVLFGVGMAIAAVNFMAWLFPLVEWQKQFPDRSAQCPMLGEVLRGSFFSSPCASGLGRSTCSAAWAAAS